MLVHLSVSTFLILSPLHAQSPGPQPLPYPAAIAAPRDVAYPGTIRLSVDATDTTHRVLRVRETIPIRAGQPLTLLYPQWLPGNHGPRGRVDYMAGLIVRANGQRLPWTRDPVDVFAFHVRPPGGAISLDVEFDVTTPLDPAQGRVVVTNDVLNLQWNQVVLYPAGYFTRQIPVEADVTVPAGWQVATALDRQTTAGARTTFRTVPLETLVDSPIFAGRHFTTFDLDPQGKAPVRLNVVADRPESLDAKPEYLTPLREMVQQAYALFGTHHYDHYDFLLALTDQLGGIGLEHHRSSENSGSPGFFTDWTRTPDERDLLPHEFVHSWNGKFRRPADLWTPNYNVPMRDSLLWVYEGQTQYWGEVLAARAGVWTRDMALDSLAITAASLDRRAGRAWRPLQDTTSDPIAQQRRPLPWVGWERSEDYYQEGQLIWLDADTLIRERSTGQKSLDDFARAFFGINDGSYVPVTYQFDDLVKGLNAVVPYDWADFLRTRLDRVGGGAPLDGITRGGYTLTYTDTPTAYYSLVETRTNTSNLGYSLGIVAGSDGRIANVVWDSPAFKAGLGRGQQILSVNGMAYSHARLRDAITANKGGGRPIELQFRIGDQYRTVPIDYRGGLQYPRLERAADVPARLDDILKAR